METGALTDVLENAGLSPYQAEAYVRLLELGTASATELADASDIPDARIYDVLRDLDGMGYVEVYEQDTFRARAVDPDVVVEDLTFRATKLEAAAEEIRDRWQQPAMDSHEISIVKRFESVREAAREFVGEADTQIHAAVTPEQFAALRDDFAAAHDRGVTVNVTLLGDDDSVVPDEDALSGACTTVRRRPRPSPFIVSADLQLTAFASNPAAVEEYGIIFDNRSFTYVFFWYFLSFMWLPWSVVYAEPADRTPVRYADVRQFILANDELLRNGASVEVEVEGWDLDSGEPVTLAGTLVDTERVAEIPGGVDSALLELTGTATLVVENGEDVYTVGGWGASQEDVEAHRITVTSIEHGGERGAAN